ncbi:hypothetical protein WH50_12565 [Pokkaliibacter plantistimulans]|uniref:Methyltransferase type 11 domain-containing protein n=1 Tax=Pokkaliibacter plantistimulans TaxID=1635171 RepID=A0ABX5LZU4_9GAMM|nr:HAD-IIIC family phosphatase [Pokkaliibacter plantistimulans]PXF30948.1 hypothetical protein WH50_12565 [Pokkaliibacter plantistimulans]
MPDQIKLVFVDLDDTLWKGTLLEDGLDNVQPDNKLIEGLRRLDNIGVLLAVVSKNHLPDVEEALAKFNLSEVFFRKEVSFEPKSIAIRRVLELVRFSPEACLFVDDSSFEQEEVKHLYNNINTAYPHQFLELIDNKNNWAISSSYEEGQHRKASYVAEEKRIKAESEYSGTFRQFLNQSALLLKVGPCSAATADRISEITLRTNQINFSSNRYSPNDVLLLLQSEEHDCYLCAAKDKYGDYGTIGFSCIKYEDSTATIQDLMLSCRIQGKGVESAIISVLAEKAKLKNAQKIVGLYRPTRRNGQISGVFESIGFTVSGNEGDHIKYELDLKESTVTPPKHVRIVVTDIPVTDPDAGIPFIRDIVKSSINSGLLQGQIIDIGAGWDGVLGEHCDLFIEVDNNKHIRLDMERYPKTDIIANAQDMHNIESNTFDSALCLEVLEHCTNPFDLSRELVRVLQPGGVAIISAPMNFPIHDTPGDYWRFTPDGLKILFKDSTEVIHEYIEGENEHPIRTVLVLRKLQDR